MEVKVFVLEMKMMKTMQGDQVLDPSVLDHYATRATWQENNPDILNFNLLQFASAYYVTKGELKIP